MGDAHRQIGGVDALTALSDDRYTSIRRSDSSIRTSSTSSGLWMIQHTCRGCGCVPCDSVTGTRCAVHRPRTSAATTRRRTDSRLTRDRGLA